MFENIPKQMERVERQTLRQQKKHGEYIHIPSKPDCPLT